MMKTDLSRILGLALALALPLPHAIAQSGEISGEDDAPPIIKGPPSVRALVWTTTPRGPERLAGIFLFKLENGVIQYAENPEGFNPKTLQLENITHVAVDLPEDIKDAIDTYEKGNYRAAVTRLENMVKRYKSLRGFDFVPVRRMEIMWLDSLRRVGNFDRLRDELELLKKEQFSPSERHMLQVFPAWEAHNARSWPRLETITRNLDTLPPGTAAAEMAFLRGEALRRLATRDGSDRAAMLGDALAEYHRAMSMDFTYSRDLMGDAILAALEIYNADERVAEYFRRWGTPDYSEDGGYNIPVKEAAWLANLLATLEPGGRKLPENSRRFLEVYQRLRGGIEEDTRKANADEATATPTPALSESGDGDAAEGGE